MRGDKTNRKALERQSNWRWSHLHIFGLRFKMADTSVSLAPLAGKRYLVTGGTGFLGWHLIPVVRLHSPYYSPFSLESITKI